MDTQFIGHLTVLTTFLPLAACTVILMFLRRFPRLASGISLAASGLSAAGALWLLSTQGAADAPLQLSGRWLASGEFTLRFGFYIDALGLLMLTLVAAVSFLVQVYSLGYMAGDPGIARYFGLLSLFSGAMLNLVLSATILQLFIFWELVGLSSYLLIGFWFEKFSASQAGKKAFVMTRLGDVFFYAGILILVVSGGGLGIGELNGLAADGGLPAGWVSWVPLFMFIGIVGKSAQFPLLTWLPDAMEGPTPVSALLHSATMVAAGVYLLARLHPFFGASPQVMTLCLAVGCLSVVLAGTMAMVQEDIKQVWAFSTVSQLGFMLMGIGAGGVAAGFFHLMTHAVFKALLFLCAGAFIHAFETNNIFAIARARGRGMRIPLVCIAIGAASLSGVPPFSGFFSKEMIMSALADLDNPVWMAGGLLGAFLTPYYAFRVVFVLWRPEGRAAPRPESRQTVRSGADAVWMSAALIVLAAATVCLGIARGDVGRLLATGVPYLDTGAHGIGLTALTLSAALAGLALAWIDFGRAGAARNGFVARWPALRRLFLQRWYLDHAYRLLVTYGVDRGLAFLCAAGDRKIIDPGLDTLARTTVSGGRWLARLHTVGLQPRLVFMFAAVGAMVVSLLIG